MMMGGEQNAEMIKTISELGEGPKSPQELLPLFASMFSKNSPAQAKQAAPAAEAQPAPPPQEHRQDPRGPQFFFPILDFAGERIVYYLSLLLR